MVCGTTPLRMLVEVGGAEVGGVAPSRTVIVSPGAETSQTIVRGAAPSRVLAGNGRPAISLLEYSAPLGRIADGVCPAAQRNRFAQYPAPRPAVLSQYDPAPLSAVSSLQHDTPARPYPCCCTRDPPLPSAGRWLDHRR